MPLVLGVRPAATSRWVPFRERSAPSREPEESDPISRVALDAGYFCIRDDGDPFITAQFFQCLRGIFVFVVREAAIAVDQRDLGAETAEGLGKFESDITSAQNQEVFRDVIKFKCLDVGQRLRLGQSRNWLKRGARADIDGYNFTPECACPAVVQGNFDGFRANEASCAHHQFRAALGEVVVAKNVDNVHHHLALALTHGGHVDANILFADAEFVAAIKERGNLGAVDDVLAGQARDVRARTGHVFALDRNHALSLLCECPGKNFAAGAAAQHEEIVFFHGFLPFYCPVRLSTARPGIFHPLEMQKTLILFFYPFQSEANLAEG